MRIEDLKVSYKSGRERREGGREGEEGAEGAPKEQHYLFELY